MQHYLIYNYKREVKIATGRIVGTTTCLSEYKGNKVTSFRVDNSTKYYTQVPFEKMKLLNGKIWCDDPKDIDECVNQVKNYISALDAKDEKDLIILKVKDNINIRNDRLKIDYQNILEQRKNGLIILPNYLELELCNTREDIEIIFEENEN